MSEVRQDSERWRWPWYFTCWSCHAPHTECTCGAYVCDHHDDCLEAERKVTK